jgi:hypothetical protein
MDCLRIKVIDDDLAERIMASGSIKRVAKPQKGKTPRLHATYRGSPGHIPVVLPVLRRNPQRRSRLLQRFGQMEVRPLTYRPNGARERARRMRQSATCTSL